MSIEALREEIARRQAEEAQAAQQEQPQEEPQQPDPAAEALRAEITRRGAQGGPVPSEAEASQPGDVKTALTGVVTGTLDFAQGIMPGITSAVLDADSYLTRKTANMFPDGGVVQQHLLRAADRSETYSNQLQAQTQASRDLINSTAEDLTGVSKETLDEMNDLAAIPLGMAVPVGPGQRAQAVTRVGRALGHSWNIVKQGFTSAGFFAASDRNRPETAERRLQDLATAAAIGGGISAGFQATAWAANAGWMWVNQLRPAIKAAQGASDGAAALSAQGRNLGSILADDSKYLDDVIGMERSLTGFAKDKKFSKLLEGVRGQIANGYRFIDRGRDAWKSATKVLDDSMLKLKAVRNAEYREATKNLKDVEFPGVRSFIDDMTATWKGQQLSPTQFAFTDSARKFAGRAMSTLTPNRARQLMVEVGDTAFIKAVKDAPPEWVENATRLNKAFQAQARRALLRHINAVGDDITEVRALAEQSARYAQKSEQIQDVGSTGALVMIRHIADDMGVQPEALIQGQMPRMSREGWDDLGKALRALPDGAGEQLRRVLVGNYLREITDTGFREVGRSGTLQVNLAQVLDMMGEANKGLMASNILTKAERGNLVKAREALRKIGRGGNNVYGDLAASVEANAQELARQGVALSVVGPGSLLFTAGTIARRGPEFYQNILFGDDVVKALQDLAMSKSRPAVAKAMGVLSAYFNTEVMNEVEGRER